MPGTSCSWVAAQTAARETDGNEKVAHDSYRFATSEAHRDMNHLSKSTARRAIRTPPRTALHALWAPGAVVAGHGSGQSGHDLPADCQSVAVDRASVGAF